MILIVDDNEENIFSLKKLLELNKFSVDTASSGEKALKLILQNTYSLIILDVQMPEMDGFEVAEAISSYSKSKDIPIIFLSAVSTHKKFIAKGYNSGGVDYVTKPFDPDTLLLKIKTFYRLSEQTRKLVEMDKFLRAEIEFRKKAENDLEQKIEELKSTLESIPQMAFTTCTDGKIEFVNTNWSAYSDNNSTFPVAEGTSIAAYIVMAIASKKQFIQEVKIKPLSGPDYRFHVLYLTPVMKNNNLIKWVGIFTDIHDQKMASQILESKVEDRTLELKNINRKLEASNIELQQFAFVASHDLQEPLRKIQVFSNIVSENLNDTQGNARNFINKVISSASRMRNLITDLLNYSQLTSKELFKESNLNAIIEEVVQDFEIAIKAKKATIKVGKFPTLEIIPGQMRQVFQNLISNSLKFSNKGIPPQISIEAEVINDKTTETTVDEAGKFCQITFRDNGIGFEQIYADKVFEIFQRLNERDTYEGTGIGLAIVKKIIDRHSGSITVKSSANEGTEFKIILPINQPQVLIY